MCSKSEIMSSSGTLRTASRDLLLFLEPETLRSTRFAVNGEYFGRIREVDRTQRWEDPRLVGIVRD